MKAADIICSKTTLLNYIRGSRRFCPAWFRGCKNRLTYPEVGLIRPYCEATRYIFSFNLTLLPSFCLPFRYKAIVNPMDIQTSSAVFWTCLKAVSIWLLSVLLAVPEAIFSQVISMQGHKDNMNVTFVNCVPYPLSNQMHPKIHSVMIFLVYFLIPLTIISVYYFHIARTLIKSAYNMPGEVSEHTKRQMETRKRLAKIVLVFVGLFALCWFPNHVLYMYRSFHYHQMDLSLAHLVITLVARVLSFSSSCVNPFALYLLSESFRRHFNSQLRCGRGPRPERQPSYMHSTSHIHLTSIKKTTPTAVIVAPAANGNSNTQEVAL
uniref:Neuromedin B receptor n=1 Tax=Xiphophorus couchianus TaxID=32473 RepID=A0A3B5MR60_9TELE